MPAETSIKPEDLLRQRLYMYALLGAYPSYAAQGTRAGSVNSSRLGASSGEASPVQPDNALVPHNPFRGNRQFIKLEQSFSEQLKKHEATFAGQNTYLLKEKMKMSADALIGCSPDKISLELTWDGSLFYKLIKNNITVHFEHFLVDEFDGSDEAIVTIYEDYKEVKNYGGTLAETIKQFATFPSFYNIKIPQVY